jgi:hypothetical protein
VAKEDIQSGPHRCDCAACRRHPRGATARKHRAINRLIVRADERCRRLLAGLLAEQQGYGGISLMARVTGLDRNTVARGLCELYHPDQLPPGRIRRPGAGRKPIEVAVPGS